MSTLAWIIGGGIAMSLLSLVGAASLLLAERLRRRLLLQMVAFAAGALIGGALFNLLPAAVATLGNGLGTYAWVAAGFTSFLAIEQWLHHQQGEAHPGRRPSAYLILVADGIHNFIDGMAIATTFLIDIRLGIVTWLVTAAHEVPQELGDFVVLLHGGFSAQQALLANFLSALTFLVGELLVYFAQDYVSIAFLVPFTAGSFLYIGAAALIPELSHASSERRRIGLFAMFILGLSLIPALGYVLPDHH